MCKLRNKLISSMLACKMHVWIIKQNDCLHVHDKSSVCTLVCKLHVCLLKKGLFARASCATNWLFDTCMQIARVDRKISDCLHVQVARQIDCLYPAGSADRLPCQSARSDIPALYLPSCSFLHTCRAPSLPILPYCTCLPTRPCIGTHPGLYGGRNILKYASLYWNTSRLYGGRNPCWCFSQLSLSICLCEEAIRFSDAGHR